MPPSSSESASQTSSSSNTSTGSDRDGILTFATATLESENLKLQRVHVPKCIDAEPGNVPIANLPLRDAGDSQVPIKHVYDVLAGVASALTPDMVTAWERGDYNSLPSPFSPASAADDVIMEMVLVKLPTEETPTLIKHFMSTNGKADRVHLKGLCRGRAMVINFDSADALTTMEVLCHMLKSMGGKRCSLFDLCAVATHPKHTRSADAIDLGYDHILQHAPASNEGLAQLRWVHKQVVDEQSPIFGWSKNDVKDAIHQHRVFNNLVTTHAYIPITFLDIAPWMRKLLRPIVKTFRTKSLVIIGAPGCGKTPLLQTLAMAVSRFYIADKGTPTVFPEACFRTGPHLGFFRGERGHVERPDFLDDGDMNDQAVSKLKAFLDVSLKGGVMYARWGAAKFVKSQCRAVADNNRKPRRRDICN